MYIYKRDFGQFSFSSLWPDVLWIKISRSSRFVVFMHIVYLFIGENVDVEIYFYIFWFLWMRKNWGCTVKRKGFLLYVEEKKKINKNVIFNWVYLLWRARTHLIDWWIYTRVWSRCPASSLSFLNLFSIAVHFRSVGWI